jgi:hypothetical protein
MAAREDQPPDWLVFGAMIRTVTMGGEEGGLYPNATALENEGFESGVSARIVEGFTRHLMMVLDNWREGSFAAVARAYVERLRREGPSLRRIDDNGELLVRHMDKVGGRTERYRLHDRLLAPSWLDPASRTVRKC